MTPELVALVILVILLSLSVAVVVRAIDNVVTSIDLQTEEIRSLRLQSRARVAQASVQSGEVSEEQRLMRLGRASESRRVVVGGDDDSTQKQALVRQTRVNQAREGGEE